MIELLTEEEKNAIDAARRYYVDFKSVDLAKIIEKLLVIHFVMTNGVTQFIY